MPRNKKNSISDFDKKPYDWGEIPPIPLILYPKLRNICKTNSIIWYVFLLLSR